MVLADVEETITKMEVDEETGEELVVVQDSTVWTVKKIRSLSLYIYIHIYKNIYGEGERDACILERFLVQILSGKNAIPMAGSVHII